MGLMEGRAVIVTGGASGIGRAAAIGFAREGAGVVVADLADEGGRETVETIEAAGGAAHFVRTDVSVAADVAAMVDLAVASFGRLDAAFNNAGHPGWYTDAVTCTEQEWDAVVGINLKSVWLCMKHEIPAMLATGGGAIVNTASTAALAAPPNMLTYTATKHGVIGLTRSAAVDFGARGIRVNALLPGSTLTPMMLGGFEGHDRPEEAFAGLAPMKRLGRPEEQADVAIWLCSDRSSYLSGASIPVDGAAASAIF